MKLHCLTNEFVCADNNVDATFFQVVKYGCRLFRRASTTQVFHTNGEVLQSVRKSAIVLIGKYGSRHHQRHLLAIACCLKCCTNGYFRLSESHVATHQAVHWAGQLHILFYLLGRTHLVGRVLIQERGFQLMLHEAVGRELESLLVLSGSIEANEVAGDVLDLLLRTLFQAFPGTSAQSVQTWGLPFPTLIFRHLVQGVNRDVNDVIMLVDNLYLLLHLPAFVDANQATKAPYSMIHMHHIIANLELLQFSQGQRHLAPAGYFGTKGVLMETVKYLMVGKQAHAQRIVGIACMKCLIDRSERDLTI